jgi:hypothetical protein
VLQLRPRSLAAIRSQVFSTWKVSPGSANATCSIRVKVWRFYVFIFAGQHVYACVVLIF